MKILVLQMWGGGGGGKYGIIEISGACVYVCMYFRPNIFFFFGGYFSHPID